MGGRFPALAVFGLPALTVALALVVLWGLRPWEDNADPHEAPLGIEMAVTGGKALPAASTAGVAAGVAVPAGPGVQAAQQAAGGAAPNSRSSGPNSGGSPATVVVAPAKAIAVAEVPSSPSPAAPESAGGGVPKGPVSAGAKPPPVLESCEGDEYVITVTFLDEGSTAEEAPAEIVLERLNDDGTTDELQLEGDLSDARALASTLEAEGNCVEVEIAQPEAEGAEEEAEVPGAGEEAPESGEAESGEEVAEPAESLVPSSP